VVAVQLTRLHVVDVLRTAGLPELADEALHDLPDPVDSEQVAAWAVPYGINMGELVSRGGRQPVTWCATSPGPPRGSVLAAPRKAR
jgi:hypothetical protein